MVLKHLDCFFSYLRIIPSVDTSSCTIATNGKFVCCITNLSKQSRDMAHDCKQNNVWLHVDN